MKEFLAFKDKLMKTQQRTILNVEYAFYQLLNIHSPLDFAQLTSSLSKNLSNASVNGMYNYFNIFLLYFLLLIVFIL